MKKRILSIITTLALCLSLLPAASLTAAAADAHTHPVCGATHENIGDHTANACASVAYQPLSKALTKVEEGSNSYYYGTLDDGGSYYVNLDTIDLKDPGKIDGKPVYAAITVNGEVNLCLNGNTLQGYDDASGGLFFLNSSSVLTLCDCGQNGTITGATRIYSGAAVNANGETFRMFGGAITGNKAENNTNGGGVYLSADGRFNMYGGAITGNTANAGADVWSDNPVVLSGAANIGKLYVNASNVMRDTYPAIQLSGALTGEASITLEKIGSHGVVAEGVNDYTVTALDAERITLPDGSGTLLVDALNNRLVLGTNIADAEVTLSQTAFTYNGEQQKPEITVKVGEDTLVEGTHYTVEWPEDTTNADTKIVNVHGKFEGDSKYAGSKTVTYTIGPKAITPAVEGVQESYPYTGSAIRPTVTVKDGDVVLTEGTDYGVTYGTNTDVLTGGSVTVTLKGNYSGSASETFGITKVDASMSTQPAEGRLTYTGKAQALVSAGVTGDGEMQYSLGGESYSAAIPTGTAVGDYTVYYKVVGDENHNDTAPASLSVTIGRATPTITWATTTKTVEYTGAKAIITAPTVTLENNEIYGGTISYSYTGTYSGSGLPTNAGTYTVTASIEAQGSYTEASATTPLSLTISPKSVTVNAEAKTKKYGEADPTLTYTASGLVNDDTLTGSLSRDAGENVGTYAIGQGTVTNENNPNYNISYTSANLTITEADSLSVSPVVKQFLYTTATTGNVVDIAALLPSDRGETSYTYEVSDDASILVLDTDAVSDGGTLTFGTKTAENEVNATITVTAAMLNYADTTITVTVKLVNKTPVTISGVSAATSLTYNGSAQRGYTGTPSSAYTGTYEITYTGRNGTSYNSSAAPVNAGDYTVTFEVPESDQTYIGSVSLDFSIGKATITVTAKNQSVYVGGTAPDLSSPALNIHYTVTGLVSGDTLGGAITMEYQTDGTAATPDTSKTGSYDIVISGATVPAGGNYNEQITFTKGTLTISNRPSSSGGGYTPPSTPTVTEVTIPISGDDNTIHVGASVSGDTATVDEVDLSRLDTVIGDDVQTGTVTIDFSGLNSSTDITTVEIPSDVVKQIAAAVSDPANDAESLEIILSDGTSIEFDAVALGEKAAQADGLDITISIERHDNAELTQAQKNTVGDRIAYDINVTSGGEHISDMGGKITVHAPYELRPGEKSWGLVVWYVDDHGNRERCETSYDPIKQRVNWKTDHLSLYMIDYDEAAAANPFTDVAEDAYYYEAVLWAADSGITSGTGDGTTFSPDDPCTRAQMATFLWRAAGSPDPVGSVSPFTDVPADACYAKAVQWAYEQGITVGTSTTTFGPDASCTRAQMATFLWRNAGSPALAGSSNPFTDVQTDAYYVKAVQWAYEQKITSGTGDGTTFSPDNPCTRAQMVTFLYRYFVK